MINKLIAASTLALFACANVQATSQEAWDVPMHFAAHTHAEQEDAKAFALLQTVTLADARHYDLGVGSGGGDPWPHGIEYPAQSVLSLEQDMLRQRLFAQFDHLKKRNWNPDKGSLAQLALIALLKPAVEAEYECTDLPHVIANNFVENIHKSWQCATILLYLPSQGLTFSLETRLTKALVSRIELLEMLEPVDHSHPLALSLVSKIFDESHFLASLTPFVHPAPLEAGEYASLQLNHLSLSIDPSHLYVREEEGEAQSDA